MPDERTTALLATPLTLLGSRIFHAVRGFDAVLTSSASAGVFTWRLAHGAVVPVGPVDAHEQRFSDMRMRTTVESPAGDNNPSFTLSLYPTSRLRGSYTTSAPAAACGAVVACVVFVSVVFLTHGAICVQHHFLGRVFISASVTRLHIDATRPRVRGHRAVRAGSSKKNPPSFFFNVAPACVPAKPFPTRCARGCTNTTTRRRCDPRPPHHRCHRCGPLSPRFGGEPLLTRVESCPLSLRRPRRKATRRAG